MTHKEKAIDRMKTLITDEIEKVRCDRNKNIDEKLAETDILFDTYKFLKEYDKNIEILRKNRKERDYERGE